MTDKERYGLFYSPRCNHCKLLVDKIESNAHSKEAIDMINIDTIPKKAYSHLRSVPTLQNEKTRQHHIGKQAFEIVDNIIKENIDAFEMGFGTNGFSFVDNESALCQGNQGFTFLTKDGFDMPSAPGETSAEPDRVGKMTGDKSDMQNVDLEKLIEQRRNEIPSSSQRV